MIGIPSSSLMSPIIRPGVDPDQRTAIAPEPRRDAGTDLGPCNRCRLGGSYLQSMRTREKTSIFTKSNVSAKASVATNKRPMIAGGSGVINCPSSEFLRQRAS